MFLWSNPQSSISVPSSLFVIVANGPNVALRPLVKRLAFSLCLVDGPLNRHSKLLGIRKFGSLHLRLLFLLTPFEVELLDDLVERMNEVYLVLDPVCQLLFVASQRLYVFDCLKVVSFRLLRLFNDLRSFLLKSIKPINFILVFLLQLPKVDLCGLCLVLSVIDICA